MKLRKSYNPIERNYSIWVIRILITLVVLLFNIFPVNNFVNFFVVELQAPFILLGNGISNGVNSVKSYFVNSKELYENYVKSKENLMVCQSNLSQNILLKEENEAFRQQLSLKDIQGNFILAKQVLSSNDDVGIMILKTDSHQTMQPGDFVVYGKAYVGKVLTVNRNLVKVLLPINKKSSMKVFIGKHKDEKEFLGKGLAYGDGVSVRIDNIVGSDVSDGDWVFVAEDNNYWVLGQLFELTDDPTAPYQTAILRPLVDPLNIKTYFIWSPNNS